MVQYGSLRGHTRPLTHALILGSPPGADTRTPKAYLNMTSLLPVVTMSVNVTVYMYRRRRALESKD